LFCVNSAFAQRNACCFDVAPPQGFLNSDDPTNMKWKKLQARGGVIESYEDTRGDLPQWAMIRESWRKA
jgi:hypothetical protein